MKMYSYTENASNSEMSCKMQLPKGRIQYHVSQFQKKREFLGTFIHSVQTTKMKGDNKSPNSDYILPLEGDKEMG